MTASRIVVIGTSAGGIEALRTVVSALPSDFAAAICIVLHTSPESPGVLGEILKRAGPLPAANATSGERLRQGHIYTAPPDRHMLVEPGVVRLTKGPRENRFRPAIDPLFRSAAQVFGPAAIGVILTGNLDDGTAGLWAVKQMGGIAIVQDPADAMFPSMPTNAMRHTRVDYTVPLSQMAPLLVRLTSTAEYERGGIEVPDHIKIEVDIAKERNALEAGVRRVADPSTFACPECHGVLLQLKEGGLVRFRCHTGHAYSLESLVAEVAEATDDALWNAIRALQEAGLVMERLADHLQQHDGPAAHFATQATEAHRHAELIRNIATDRETVAAPKA